MRANWKWATTTGLGAIAFTITSGAASAFFPPILASTPDPITITQPPPVAPVIVTPVTPKPVVTPPILIEPVTPLPPVVIPPVPPPPFVPPVVPVVPQGLPPTCPPCYCLPVVPQSVPEPTTILSGLIGLAAVAGNAVRRRRGDNVKA